MDRLLGHEIKSSDTSLGGAQRIRWCVPLLCAALWCWAAYAQEQTAAQNQPSELAGQNLDRVAASAAQIESVLHKDPGIMVELKRWIAKDATEHGRFISDSDLMDQGIYDRLETDVEFRSVATILVQKYGYLLPQFNPESPQAREQTLLIEERAKWLAQDEEEQMREVKQRRARVVEQGRECDAREGANCVPQNGVYPIETQPEEQIGTPLLPQSNPTTPGNPKTPASPAQSLGPLQRADLTSSQAGVGIEAADMNLGEAYDASSLALLSDFGKAGPGTLVPLSFTGSATDSFTPQQPFGESTLPPPDGQARTSMNGSVLNAQSPEVAARNDTALPAMGTVPGMGEARSPRYEAATAMVTPSRRYGERSTAGLSQAMLRQPVPYADVPSLYDMYLQAAPQPPKLSRFGMQVFDYGSRDSQLIPFDLPVGPDYVVGPGDGLSIDMWGGVSQRLFRTVDRQGRVSLPEAGPLLVAGKSLAGVQESLQKVLRSQFRDVSADVSLSRLRTIRIYVVGDVVRPGAYDISSLSTPLNAIFVAGGPTSQGSLRILKHNRGDRLVENVDVYDLLLHGVRSDVQRLENGDTVLVPPIGSDVTVEGMVRRPAVYELRDEKSLSDVLTLAGGLLPTATLRHIEVQRIVAHDKRTMLSLDIPPDSDPAAAAKQLDSFQVQDSDSVRVFPIAPYNQDTLYLEGHVLRPGRYSFRPGMRVTDLVSSYKDLLPEPATQYAEIIRLNPPDYRPTVESFNLADALSHPLSAPSLEPLDTVQIFGRYDFENPPTVSVWGDVRTPGTYKTSGQLRLSDAIHMAGGLSPDANRDDAQVFRYLADGQLKIFSVKLSQALDGDAVENIVLSSRDRILVHRNAANVQPATVYIKGEVAQPGQYPLTTNMTVDDLIRSAGGPKQSADLQDADLTHFDWNEQSRMSGHHEEILLSDALARAPQANLSLHNGDVLTIRKLPGWDDLGASITVRGEVVHAGSYGIKPGERLSSVLKRAGGFMPDAYPYGVVLTRPEVQQIEAKSQTELVERVREQQVGLKLDAQTATDPDAKLADQAAYQQWQNTMDGLINNPPLGRVTIQISGNIKSWEGTPRDIVVRAGDRLLVPKKPSYVMVQGQVYNPTAVAYRPGKNAKWYLGQAGGPTNLANKRSIFVIRADGSVIGTRGSPLLLGSALGEPLEPGDMVVVPEKALGGPPQWKQLFQAVQIGSSVATSAIFAARY